MPEVDNLLNDKFRVLLCLYDYRGPDNYSRITQQDISEKLNHAGSDVTKLYVKADKSKLRDLQDSIGI